MASFYFKRIIRRKRFECDKLKTEKVIVSRKSNVKEHWKMIKRTTSIDTKSNIKSDTFSEYFQNINNPNDRFYQADEDVLFFNERYVNDEFQIMFEELNIPLSYSEVLLAVKQLRNAASAGPELGKLFTRVLNNRLNGWAETYRICCEAQAEVRKNMGTGDNLFVLNSLITHFINQNKQLYCVFVDFTKAFDYVVRDKLRYKLLKVGVRGRMFDIIKSIYSTVKS